MQQTPPVLPTSKRFCVKFNVLSELAQIPSKSYASDVCFDITVIGRQTKEGLIIDPDQEDVPHEIVYYKTGLIMEPPLGYHIKIYPRSSLHTLGYELVTGVSVIDPEYRGEILIPLRKFDEKAKSLDIPSRAVQMEVAKTKYPFFEKDKSLTQKSTQRGAQGFGSTGTGSSKRRLQHLPLRVEPNLRSAAALSKVNTMTTF